MSHAFDARFAYGPGPYIFHGCVGNLLLVPIRMKQAPTSGRSLGDQRQTSPAVALGYIILPPSRQAWIMGERFQPSGYTATSVYWAHNTSMRSVGSILARRGQP
jgi:hypothetical protein